MGDRRRAGRFVALAMVVVIGVAPWLAVPGADATGFSPNVRKGADIVMSELRWPRWDQGTYYCFWYITFFPNKYCTFYGGLATHGAKTRPGMFMSYWGGMTNIHEGEHFYRHGYGAEGAKGGANGKPPFLRPGAWYRMVMRVWSPVQGSDEETYVGWWVKDVEKNEWHTHSIVSIPSRETGVMGNSGFVEALAPESVHRAFERRLGYCRLDGKWFKTNKVGTQNPSQFKLIEGGTVLRFDRPVEGDIGGQKTKTYVTTKQADTPTLDQPAVERVQADVWGSQVTVRWQIPGSAAPQLGYKLEVFGTREAEGAPLAMFEESAPHVRAKRLDAEQAPKSVRLTVTDIFDQKKSIVIPAGTATLAPATEAARLRPGLRYLYYEAPKGARWERLPDLSALKPAKQGRVSTLDDTIREDRDKLYALRYTGYLRVPADGLYVISSGTCDGSRLSVDGKVVADNDGIHSASVKQYPLALSPGLHAFELAYFKGPQAYLADRLSVSWEGPGFGLRPLSRDDFVCSDSPGLPSIDIALNGAVSEGVLRDNQVEIRAATQPRGHRVNRVQLFRGRQLLQSRSLARPDDVAGIAFDVLLPEGDSQIWARLWYDDKSSVESNELTLTARNRTDGPWKFDVLGESVFPLGVRHRNGRMSFSGEGFCFGHQRVTGDFTLTARIADISLSSAENGICKSNWLGLFVKGKRMDQPFAGSHFGIYRTAGQGMRGPADFPDLAGGRISIPSFSADHRWLRVVRRGKRFQAFTSADGHAWQKAMERIIPRFPDEAHAGVCFRAIPGKSRSFFNGAMDHVTLEADRVPKELRERPREEDLRQGKRITALVQTPKSPEILFARSNGSGLLRSADRGLTWLSADAGLTSPEALAVRSVAVHPGDNSIVLRGGGRVVGGRLRSGLWRSADSGRSWRLVTRDIDFDGHGPTTLFGEVTAFCPENPGLVAAGGETSGLFISEDGGRTWKHAGLKGERITCLGFVPTTRHKRGTLVVGTFADSEFGTLGLGKPASPVKAPGRIYWVGFRDGRIRKSVSCELDGFGVTNIAFDMHENFVNFATTRGVYYTWVHGLVFSQRRHDVPADVLFAAIGSRPHSDWSAITYAAPFSSTEHGPVYFTNDRSRKWSVLSARPQVTGEGEVLSLGAGLSCIVRDRDESSTLYVCNRHGILKSTDHGRSYRLVHRCAP